MVQSWRQVSVSFVEETADMLHPIPPGTTMRTLSAQATQSRWRTEAMRSHAGGRLIHISKGQGRITIAGLTTGYGPNNLIYLPPDTMYGMEVGTTVFGQVLSLPDASDWPTDVLHLRLRDVDPQKEVIGLFEAIEKELLPEGDARAAQCHLGLLAIFIERQCLRQHGTDGAERRQSGAAKLVARYTQLLNAHYGSGQGVAHYAAVLQVTPTHLSRCCRQTSGKSALQLLNDRIHYEACKMLSETKAPVRDVAADLGFRSPAYFTRSFQEKTGQTPTAFRRAQQPALA